MEVQFIISKSGGKGAILKRSMQAFSSLDDTLEHLFNDTYSSYNKPTTVASFVENLRYRVNIFQVQDDGKLQLIGKSWLKKNSELLENRIDLLANYLLRN